jgi:hypothetical protein
MAAEIRKSKSNNFCIGLSTIHCNSQQRSIVYVHAGGSMKSLLLILALTLTAGCGQNSSTPSNPPTQPAETEEGFIPGPPGTLAITDQDAKPLAGAQVLIGQALNSPFQGNFLKTDSSGLLKAPAEWTTPQPVTIQAPGQLRVTFLSQLPEGQRLRVHRHSQQINREIKGMATGLEAFMKEKDGYIDFAIVSPLVLLEDLFLFQSNQIISPETDKIKILGQSIDLPANLSVPKQVEKFGILSFTVEKSTYRLKVAQDAETVLMANRGRAKVSDLKKGAGSEMLNAVEFTGGGTKKVEGGTGPLNVSIPQEFSFSGRREVQAPQLNAGEIMGSLAFTPYDQNRLMLTDAKIHSSNQKWALAIPTDKPLFFVFLWGKKDADPDKASSLMLASPGVEEFNTKFLPLIKRPQVSSKEIIFTPPPQGSDINPSITYLALSDVVKTQTANFEAVQVTKRWEFFSPGWVQNVQIPVWPEGNVRIQKQARWEVMFLGRSGPPPQVEVEITDFSSTTHATRNYIDM